MLELYVDRYIYNNGYIGTYSHIIVFFVSKQEPQIVTSIYTYINSSTRKCIAGKGWHPFPDILQKLGPSPQKLHFVE